MSYKHPEFFLNHKDSTTQTLKTSSERKTADNNISKYKAISQMKIEAQTAFAVFIEPR